MKILIRSIIVIKLLFLLAFLMFLEQVSAINLLNAQRSNEYFEDSLEAIQHQQIHLTETEKKWLLRHNGEIRLAPDPYFPPYEFFNSEGRYCGIGDDYLKLLQKKTGVKFRIVRYKNWAEIINAAKKRDVDVIALAASTAQRREYLDFTQSHFTIRAVLITRSNVPGKLSLDNLKGMRVSVAKDYVWYDLLSNNYPDILIDTVPDAITGLRKVSFGLSDAVLASTAVASYYMQQEGISNLKVAGETDFLIPLAIGIRNDWSELVSILNKGISLITEAEKKEILNKWIFHTEVPFYQSRKFWNFMVFAFLIMTLLIGSILLINRRLKRMVRVKTFALRNEQNQLKNTNQKLQTALIKAAESDRLTKAFLANISHEIRTPMNSIMGFSQIIEMEDLSASDRSLYASQVVKSGQQLVEIINSIVNISKVDAEFIKPHWQKVHINAIIEEVVELYQPTAQKIGLKLSFQKQKVGLSDLVETDAVMVKQILNNLLSNALKFTPSGSVIIGYNWTSSDVEFFVTDTGIGIPQEYRDSIFEPFVQLEDNDRHHAGGTGLGLTLAKRLVQALGGQIRVKSVLHQGTTFYFSLPFENGEIGAGK